MIMMIESKLANNCNDDNNNVKMIYQHYHHGTRLKCRSKSEQRKFSNMIIYNHQNEKSNIILNFTSFIHLVSIFSLINLVVIGGQKISHDSNHYHQITSNENSESNNNNNNNNNRFYFKNGTAFHFGGQNHHHSTHPSSSSSSSNVINNDSFKTRPITGSVIHVSDAINVNDRSDSDQDYSRTQTHSSNYHHPKDQRYYIHHHPLHNQIDHIDRGSILHRQLNANYNVQEGRGFNINQFNRSAHDDRRLITSAHQGGRTDLESYHRAAAIPYDNSAVIVSSDNAGELHSTGGNFYRGTITDVTDSFGDNRAILGSANAGYGRLHLSGTQASHNLHNVNAHHGLINRTQIGAIDRNIVHTGAPYTIDSGHQNRIQTGAINRTFVHSGTGPNVYATGHRHNQTGSLNAVNRTIGYGGQTIPIHSGYQQGGVNVRPINHTAIYSGSHIYSSNHTGTGATVNQTHGPITYSGPNTRINTISDSSSSNRIIDDVRNNRLQSQPSSVIGSSSDNTRSSNINENINDNNINGQTLRFNNNVKPSSSSSSSTAQSSGTAIVSLNSLDNVEIEAINKARIYAEHESEENAKKHALNVVRLAATDQLESEIITNRTRAYLSCESGEMIVKINFTEPFRGVGYADYDRTSPCKFYGDGGRYYEMRLPLKGCGTKQEAPRIFINNIILRFHRALELEEDEIKTIVCRYPPPLAPPPPLIAAPILEQPPPAAPFLPAKLSEVELLLIVSALLFLTLLLLGIGIGYYCLKKRKVKVVRKFVPPAEIPYFPPPSISSEEHSIISEGSVIHRDDYQFQNLGYIPEAKLSYLDDMFYNDQDMVEGDVVQTQQNIMVPPVINRFTKKYDDQFVTNASETEIDTDYEVDRLIVPKKPKITKLVTDKYFVTPKTETEIIDEVTTQRFIVPPKKPITTRYVDDTMITPYSDLEIDEMTTNERIYGPKKPISTQKVDDTYLHSQQETDIIDDVDKYRITSPKKQPHVKNTDDYYRTDLYEIDEVIDDFDQTISNAIKPTTHVTSEDDLYITHSRDVEEFVDDTTHRVMKTTKTPQKPIEPPRKPKITVKNIDDFYITNITETETNEQITKIGRSMPNLTLEIDYEEEIEQEQERMIEETSRLTGFDVKLRSIPRKPTKPTTTTTTTKSTSETISKTKIDEIVRILDNPPRERIPNIDEHFMLPTRNRFRQIIMTDEVFRTLIIESTTTEEYVERIQCHPKYGSMFEPPTWNVIFRILALPEVSQIRPVRPTRYSDTYRSGYSAQEVRSVTEEDVIFTRNRMSGAHFTPLPDYPMDDDEQSLKSGDWNKRLPDPKRYECHSPDFQPIKSAFSITRRTGSGRRSRPSGTISPISTSSSVFGTRRLENPYTTTTPTTTTITPTTRRGLYEYDFRPYSPDLDALSLEPSQSYLAYSGSIRHRNNQLYHHHQQQQATLEEREEIKSTTETNVYDWKRYS